MTVILAIDTESNGKDYRHDPDAKTTGVSIATSVENADYFPFQHELGRNHVWPSFYGAREYIRDWILRADVLLMHNAKHDILALDALGIDIRHKHYYCTMLETHFVNEALPNKSLDYVSRWLNGPRKVDSPLMKKFIKVMGWGAIPVEVIREYAEVDARAAFHIHQKLYPTFVSEGYDGALWEREKRFTDLIMRMEALGVAIDQDLCEQEIEYGSKRMQDILNTLGFNPMSGPDLKKVLIDEMGLPVQKLTDKGNPSFDKEAMELYEPILERRNDPTARLILEYRGWQKTISSNYGSYIELQSRHGNLHPSFKLHGTRSGRLSCEKPNLQQIPRSSPKRWNGSLKKAFRPRRGFRLFEADYSNLELRLAAVYSQEPNLIGPFQNGFKPFDAMAELMYGPEYTQEQRQDMKTQTYACVPLDTQILTKRGWLAHDEVREGDYTIGYSFGSGKNEWTKVTKVVHYDNAEVVSLQNKHWSFASTPNHRWVRKRRHWQRKCLFTEGYTTTEEVASEDSLILSAPLNASPKVNLTLDEVSLLAWLVTDGHVRWSDITLNTSQSHGTKRGVSAVIIQHKERGIQDLDDLMQMFPHTKSQYGNRTQYYIKPQTIREIWNKANLHNVKLADLVLGFDLDQARAFYDACMLAEGYGNKFSQNKGDVLEAFQLVAYMCGYQPRLRFKEVTGAGNDHYVVYSHSPTVTGQRLKKIQQKNQAVWCVQTELGTWTAKQNDQIALTGNTLYGGGVNRLKDLFLISFEEAKRRRDDWFAAYPGMKRASDKAERLARRRGYIEMWTGRRNHLGPNESYKALNRLLQGGAAELVKSVMLALDEVIDWDTCRMLLQVHDSVLFEIAKGREDYWLYKIREVMENVGIHHSQFGQIPFPVEIKEYGSAE